MRTGRGIRIGRAFGIEIVLDYSWFLVSILISWSLSSLFSEDLPGLAQGSYVLMGILAAALFFVSLLAHELAHALVAKRKGIEVRSITLFIFGGVAQIKSEPAGPGDEFQIAAVGPLMSLVLGGVLMGMGIAAELLEVFVAAVIFQTLGLVNGMLALFNLIPGFPLDGGRILRSAVWKATGDVLKATKVASIGGRIMALALIAGGIYRIFVSREFFGGTWWIFLGMFLNQAAVTSYQQVLVRSSLKGVKVRDLMTPDPMTIPGNVRLDEAVGSYFLVRGFTALPVMGYGGELEGMVFLRSIQEQPREQWQHLTVRQVMVPIGTGILIDPDADLSSALDRVESNPTGRFAVVEDGALIGILGPGDIARYLSLKRPGGGFRKRVSPPKGEPSRSGPI